jgi:CHAP domain
MPVTTPTSAVSGLDPVQRTRCRDRAVQAAKVALANAASMSYTEGPLRWSGIQDHRNAALGQFPVTSDCSSFATWCLWNGLFLQFGLGDLVNADHWQGGYTGTMLQNGKQVREIANVLPGDCVIYGTAAPGVHTAIVTTITNGTPYVISHGSQAGPFFLVYDYRPDVLQIRRYI